MNLNAVFLKKLSRPNLKNDLHQKAEVNFKTESQTKNL